MQNSTNHWSTPNNAINFPGQSFTSAPSSIEGQDSRDKRRRRTSSTLSSFTPTVESILKDAKRSMDYFESNGQVDEEKDKKKNRLNCKDTLVDNLITNFIQNKKTLVLVKDNAKIPVFLCEEKVDYLIKNNLPQYPPLDVDSEFNPDFLPHSGSDEYNKLPVLEEDALKPQIDGELNPIDFLAEEFQKGGAQLDDDCEMAPFDGDLDFERDILDIAGTIPLGVTDFDYYFQSVPL